ncbi:MAG: HD domain-containing phosphohydrolase [Anaerolineales bacterium]
MPIRWRRPNILTQITFPYIILAIIIVTGGAFLLTRVVEGSVEERFTNQLIDTARLAKEAMVRREDRMLEALRLISFTQGVDTALQAHQTSSLPGLVLPVAFNAEIEAVVLITRDGKTLLSRYLDGTNQTYEELVVSTPYDELNFVNYVLAGRTDQLGDKFSGWLQTEVGDYIFIAGPVKESNGVLVGAVLIGHSMESLTRELREETLGHLAFYTADGDKLVSTLPGSPTLETDQAETVLARQEEGTFQREIDASGTSYTELLTPLELRSGQDIGVMGVALANQVLVQTGQLTRDNLVLVMGAALALVVVVGTIVAGRITRPIRDLRDAALKVSGGNLDVKVSQAGGDEVGVLTQSFNEMVVNLSRSKQDLLDTYDETIEGWARALDMRDHETEDHSRRVAEMTVRLGKQLGIAGEQLKMLYRGALLHDIGKMAVSDKILLKPKRLTAKETKEMHKHPQHAKQLLEQIAFLKPAIDIPYCHHEKWDGSGYPQGLKGEQIPLLARIFSVVDAWDAMTSDRVYRKAASLPEALDELRAGKGKHFEPKVVDAFLEMLGGMLKEKQAK